MAQSQPELKLEEGREIMEEADQTSNVRFRFNAQAPEFVPRLTTTTTMTPVPVSGYFYPCVQFLGGSSSPDWFYIEEQHDLPLSPNYWLTNHNNCVAISPNCSKNTTNNNNVITDDLQHKIIKQVEYQFCDISLLANETLSKQISKDPEGYVPISIIASTKKIKSLTSNNNMLAEALRCSSKLAVSDDGKKVRRKTPFTDRNKEELQSRTIVAENLPDDHSHQNLEKIFRVAGSVKTIRVCHPQESNSSRSKGDFFVSNKLHALVEYESADTADRAVEKLNDERNWRKGLRVRLLLRCSPKSVLKNRRSEFDGITDDDETPTSESADDAFHSGNTESMVDSSGDENSPMKKGWGRVRGKGRGRGQSHHVGRGMILGTQQPSSPTQGEASPRHGSKGPRMPDGTKGFTIGRGKPLSSLAPPNYASN